MFRNIRNRKTMVALAMAVIAIMLVMTPIAMAKSSQANGAKGSGKGQDAPTALVNASRMLGKAVFFWTAAEYLNANGFKGATCDIDLSSPELAAKMDHARYMLSYAYGQYAEGNIAGAVSAAKEVFADAEWAKTYIEDQIHVEWRSAGEFNHIKEKKTLIFGSDPYVCGGAAYSLAAQGIDSDVSIDKWLTSWDLSDYDVLIFDPEYRLYGIQAGTGRGPTGWYGGLSPIENAYLEPLLATDQIGLVYMEPIDVSSYTSYGQISFIKTSCNLYSGAWVGDPMPINIIDGASPVAAGLPATFNVASNAQWNSLPLIGGQPMITNVNVVATTAGPTITTFNYGLGRVVLTAFDSAETNNMALSLFFANARNWVRPTP